MLFNPLLGILLTADGTGDHDNVVRLFIALAVGGVSLDGGLAKELVTERTLHIGWF